MGVLERGFKSWCERTSLDLRRELDLTVESPLNPTALASFMEVRLWTPSDVPALPESVITQLLEVDPDGWSAVSLVSGGRSLVIYNPRHSAARRASDITHELGHLLLGHKPSNVILSADGSLALRSHDEKQEAEADWLSGTILLPREALLHARRMGWTTRQIAKRYGISAALATYRLRMTGVENQVRSAMSAARGQRSV